MIKKLTFIFFTSQKKKITKNSHVNLGSKLKGLFKLLKVFLSYSSSCLVRILDLENKILSINELYKYISIFLIEIIDEKKMMIKFSLFYIFKQN